jgi:hypothetical protein
MEFPKLVGTRKELFGGRLLHYVTFDGGDAELNKDNLIKLIEDKI